MNVPPRGIVHLIGAGPGDPGLITLKGLQCIREADVVIYDYLAAPALLTHARAGTEMIYVGKKGGDHTLSQEGINALIVEKACKGLTVARLKGGDPYVFGRGGEEAEVLVENGIAFDVVPGVTAGVAAAAYAGIPVTHRDLTATVAFVTGHEDPKKEASNIDWRALATGIGTVVFYMGVKNLPRIVKKLTENGRAQDTPVAVIRWGTTNRQRTVTGTLSDIEEKVRSARLTAPAIIVVGEVVGLREKLKWFEDRPLFGKTVVVTRAREQASDLCERLRKMGADCLEMPTIAISEVEDPGPIDSAIENLPDYDWIVFTSVNGVTAFFDRLFLSGRDVRSLGHIRTAVIGPATANRLRSYGLGTDIIPASFRAESVVEAFEKEPMTGKKVLLPRAKEARPILPVELVRMGAIVEEVAVYRTRQVTRDREDLISRLENGKIDLVTFTSSSTVRNFAALLPAGRAEALMKKVTVASIGPITSETATELGFTVHIDATTYTVPGLCEAIAAYFAGRQAA